MSFLRKLFSTFTFGAAEGSTSRPKMSLATELSEEELGAGDKPSGFVPSPLFPTDPLCDANRMEINPVTGLPMVSGIDIVGNPYGANLS